MKKSIALLLSILLLLTVLPGVVFAAWDGTPLIHVESSYNESANTVTAKVKLGEYSSLKGIQISLKFDSEKLSCVDDDVTLSGALKGGDMFIQPAGSTIAAAWDGTKARSGAAGEVIMEATFSVVEGKNGDCVFEIITYVTTGGDDETKVAPAGSTLTSTVTIPVPPKPATGITLDKSATTIYTGRTETLTATVIPADTTDSVVWTSDNESVATVADGVVTAVAPGTAVITAKAGEKSATCTVTVENAPCTHSEKIDHPAQASTCKDKGWDAYDECKECHQLFDKAGNKIDAIPYRALSTTHTPAQTATEEYLKTPETCTSAAVYYEHCSVCGKKLDTTFTSGALKAHTESGWKMSSDGHWKVCTECNHVTTEMVAHTPDHEGHATEAYAIKCTVCGYEIEAQLAHTHHHLTPVPAKAATCTEAGNKAYYTCSGCDNWYEDAEGNTLIADHDSVKLAALNHDWKPATCTEPKTCRRPGCGAHEGTALGHNPGVEWKMNESTHWHICTRCNEQVNETLGRHEPDREAPTVNDPMKCKDCGYEIMPVLPTIRVELPFTVTVKQGGNVAPGKQAFELEIFNIGNSNESEYADVKITATVETNGKGDYTAKLVISGSEEQVNALISEGFYVREKNTKAESWTYSDAVWHVVFEDSIPTVYPTTMETTDNGVNYEDGEAVESNTMTFVNTYTANETPKPTPDTPKTGDNGATVWLIALPVAALAATAVVIGKKKHESE